MNDQNLDNKFMISLRELSDNEQDAIKVFSALYINSYNNIKNAKLESLNKSIVEQIEFYGRKKDKYSSEIDTITTKYSNAIDKIINEYNTWYCAVLGKLQDSYNNQIIAISNSKLSIDAKNEVKKEASKFKMNNYEIVIQECKGQLKSCNETMENKLNEMFFDRNQSLSLNKTSIFQKFIYLFSGKSKINNFVINSLNKEMDELNNVVDSECKKINNETINNVAIIEDAILQTQTIFNNMLKEYGYYE